MREYIKAMSDEYSEYLKDESRNIGKADGIAFPQDEKQLIAILKQAYSSGKPITIQGARTGLAAGAVPDGGLIINLSRMNKVLGLSRDESGRFYANLQPGVVLSKLRELITSKSFDTEGWPVSSLLVFEDFKSFREQFFTCDPTESSCTIGGMVACNASGARSYLYGSVRPHVTALKVILADGRSLKIKRGEVFAKGRRLSLTLDSEDVLELSLPAFKMPDTKNASGYYIADNMDAIDLFIGSDGTLGIITEIELALIDAPGIIWGVAYFFESEHDAISFVEKMREIKNIAAIEYFDNRALDILRNAKHEMGAFSKLPDIIPNRVCIYIEIHCSDEESAEELLIESADIMESCGGNEEDSWACCNKADLEKLIFFRHAAPECVNMIIAERKRTDPVITKLSTDFAVPHEHFRKIISIYHEQLRELSLEYAIWGHIGDSHVHVNVLARNAAEHTRTKELFADWACIVSEMGGTVSAEHGVGKLKSAFLKTMYGEHHIIEMAKLKSIFDPLGLLGAGNMFIPIQESKQ